MPQRDDREPTDAELLSGFLGGDQSAFRRLAERHSGLVYGVATRRAPALADEIVQNVFLTLARKARSLDASRGLGAWLHKVATSESANAARKESNRHRTMQRYAEDFDAELRSKACDPEWLAALDESLAGLGETDRVLIVMRYYESLSYRDIGRRLGTSEEAGRKRVARALHKLSLAMGRRVGAAVPTVALAALLGAALPAKAPAAVVTLAAGAAAATASSTALASTGLSAFAATMKTSHLAFTATLALAATVPVVAQWQGARARDADAPRANSQQPHAPPPVASPPLSALRIDVRQAARALDLAALAAAIANIRGDGDQIGELLELQAQMYRLQGGDLPAVGDLLSTAGNREALRPVIDAYFARWAEIEPEAALEATKDEPRWGTTTTNARVEAAQTWAASDPEAAVAWCEAQAGDTIGSILKMCVFREWAIREPQAALARTANLGDRRASYRKELLSVWSHHDPEAALAWALSVDDETERSQLVDATVESACQQQPERGFALASALQDPILRAESLQYALMQWMALDKVRAARAYLNLPQSDRSARLGNYVASYVDRDSPRLRNDTDAKVGAWLAEQGEVEP